MELQQLVLNLLCREVLLEERLLAQALREQAEVNARVLVRMDQFNDELRLARDQMRRLERAVANIDRGYP